MLRRKNIIKKIVGVLALSMVITTSVTGCQSSKSGENEIDTSSLTIQEIEEKAKEEGKLASLGMPDTWANWVETWEDIESKYGIKHNDTDMSSAEEVAKFDAEKNNATADIGDVGISFGPIAIITDKTKVDKAPQTWEDLKNGNYKVCVGDVTKATQAQNAVLSAAYAFGGDESNLQPGIDFFAELAKNGRISSISDAKPANLEKGEIEVAFLWDFNALNYADQIDRDRFEITILDEASVMSGYATIINKYGKNPHAAKLAREYILSDEGQENLAKGYARPIRNVELSEDVKSKLLDDSEYKNVITISDYEAWEKSAAELPQKWQQEVLVHVK